MTKSKEHELVPISPAALELIQHLLFVGPDRISRSLEMIHDIALYHSNLPIDQTEKYALLDLKLLMEQLNQLYCERLSAG